MIEEPAKFNDTIEAFGLPGVGRLIRPAASAWEA
jgi:hypothetical protein